MVNKKFTGGQKQDNIELITCLFKAYVVCF